MLQGLILLRDVILAVLLSWIGADYGTGAEADDDRLSAQKVSFSNTSQALVYLDLKFENNSPSCEELFRS